MKNFSDINLAQRCKDGVLGLQHLVAMFGATTLVPLLTGLDVSVALFSAGIGTLIFHFVTKKQVPVFLGSSFAFIPVIAAVMHNTGSRGHVQGGLIAAGLLYLLFSFLVMKVGIEKINYMIPPYIVGTMIAIIGLSLIPVAINMASYYIPLAVITLVTALIIHFFSCGFTKQLSIIIAVGVGYISSLIVNAVDTSIITSSAWISVPAFTKPVFDLNSIFIIAPVVLATFMEHIGDITASGTVANKNFLKEPGLHKTLIGDGLATVFAGLVGGPANTTYSENTGVLAITKNYDPKVLRIAAVFAILLAFISKIGAVLSSIHVAVLGGISLLLFFMIAHIGIKTLIEDKFWISPEKIFVIAAMTIIAFSSFSLNITSDVSLSGMGLAAIVGIILNTIAYKKIKRHDG